MCVMCMRDCSMCVCMVCMRLCIFTTRTPTWTYCTSSSSNMCVYVRVWCVHAVYPHKHLDVLHLVLLKHVCVYVCVWCVRAVYPHTHLDVLHLVLLKHVCMCVCGVCVLCTSAPTWTYCTSSSSNMHCTKPRGGRGLAASSPAAPAPRACMHEHPGHMWAQG